MVVERLYAHLFAQFLAGRKSMDGLGIIITESIKKVHGRVNVAKLISAENLGTP